MAPQVGPWLLVTLLLLLLLCGCVESHSVDGQTPHLQLADWPKQRLWRFSEAAWATASVADAQAALEELLRRQPSDPSAMTALGSVLHRKGDLARARALYEGAMKLHPRDGQLMMNAARLSFEVGERERSAELYRRALDVNESLAVGKEHDIALAFHYAREYAVAESFYRRAADRSSAAFHFDFGVTLERRGKFVEAGDEYNKALAIDQTLAEAWLNIAALHHLHGDVNASISNYMRAINLPMASPLVRLMAMTNVAVAYELLERIISAMMWYNQALHQLQSVPFKSNDEAINVATNLHAHLGRAKKTAADWSDAEEAFDELWGAVSTFRLSQDRPSALLPFDTLLYPMQSRDRKKVALVHSRQYAVSSDKVSRSVSSKQLQLDNGRLHVGFLSYDFSNHPTTHLMEGIFAFADRSRFSLIAFGYGRDDGSTSRKRLVSSADKFLNLATFSFEEGAESIRDERIHILMDAQGHTRGSRMKIMALRPAPITVNYLVYPGTSGASFVDYIVADVFVTPPAEAADAFTEKLVLLPHSYQVNYYGKVSSNHRSSLWDENSRLLTSASSVSSVIESTESRFVFVNFNKIDKVEADVFGIWMAIMRRVPGSTLLLLDPSLPGQSSESSDQAKRNILREARARGILSSRVQFLPRVSKQEHLRRHALGGLFLDTFIYGAHSTATDALYAGLPVLTLAGDSFASRVGVSLLENCGLGELVTHNRREFEDLAVYLASHPNILANIKRRLRVPGLPQLFRTEEHTQSLEASWRAMYDVRKLTNSSFHLRILPK